MVALLIDKEGLTRRAIGTHPSIIDGQVSADGILIDCRCLGAAEYLLERAAPLQAMSEDAWRFHGLDGHNDWFGAAEVLIEAVAKDSQTEKTRAVVNQLNL
jgi:hypothetical protein